MNRSAGAKANPVKLLCDEMLGALARWLRAAGYDTALAEPGAPDATLVARAREEDRVLVSRDRRLMADGARGTRAVLLLSNRLEAQASELRAALALDWMLAPFTRCLVDNTQLRGATEAEIANIPDRSRALPGPFRACPCCGRVFWPGSHARRMLRRLEAWRDQAHV